MQTVTELDSSLTGGTGGSGALLGVATTGLAASFTNIASKFLSTKNLFCCEKKKSFFFFFFRKDK